MEPLATPADLELLTGLGLPPDRADLLLGQASALVRSYCGWHIAPTSADEPVTVDGSGGRVQGLPTLHLTELHEVTVDGSPIDVADVDWSATGYLSRAAGWTCKPRGVVATITHGYATTPAEVQAVVCSVASRAAVSPTGIVREQTGPFSVTYSQGGSNQAGGIILFDSDTRVLDRYRIPLES